MYRPDFDRGRGRDRARRLPDTAGESGETPGEDGERSIPADNPAQSGACSSTSPVWFAEYNISIAPILGYSGGAGAFSDFGGGASGYYGNYGTTPTVGLGGGFGAVAGVIYDGQSAFEGDSMQVTLGLGPASLTMYRDKANNRITGWSFGRGAGAAAGFAATRSRTVVLSYARPPCRE
jgi:hypothetical protein